MASKKSQRYGYIPMHRILDMTGDDIEPVSYRQPVDQGYDIRNLVEGSMSSDAVKRDSQNLALVRVGTGGKLVERPHMDALLNASYSLIAIELDKLIKKSLDGDEPLSPTETRQMESYMKLIRTLGQEERDQRTADKMSDLENKDLLKTIFGDNVPDELKDALES